ncbi:hypothetical protein SAMN05421640_0865 [Ekhidna lutea]|uniref:Lipocalin-like domain-containing protein n=1 Tax=Ekhidna lutea TaxID=447679 RepID=A0A239GIP5_EKHLU|nr:hypothetical protein [Ekhidna lutea]SNS69010.1 hypothetical protein SAMN05421640_0865 [Ekhidna lutea]
MKKVLCLLAASMILLSCGKDDGPVITHEMGSWDLDSFILTNLPAEYSNNEGRIFLVNQISFGGLVFESYEITFNSDLTYERSVGVPGPDIKDNGTWELDGDDLILMSEDADQEEEYRVEQNEDDQLWWSIESQFSLVKDAIADTITQEYIDTLTDEEFFDLFDAVSVDLVYAFERQ